MSLESVLVHHERHFTQQYVQDIFVADSFSAVNETTTQHLSLYMKKAHVYLSIVLLYPYSCCIPIILCCSSDLCNITFSTTQKMNIVAYCLFDLTHILYM